MPETLSSIKPKLLLTAGLLSFLPAIVRYEKYNRSFLDFSTELREQ